MFYIHKICLEYGWACSCYTNTMVFVADYANFEKEKNADYTKVITITSKTKQSIYCGVSGFTE